MIELRIQGQAVDVAPDTKITLNFNSNIFGDISKITPSNSLTITLPKTPKNTQVFGAPSVVGGSSIAPYRRWNAELYVNGVAIVDTAYAVLLSVGESYEIALYWGVVTALSTLKDNGKTLADINQVLEIKYGGENWWSSWEGTYGIEEDGTTSRNLINAIYESGIEDLRNNTIARAQVALLPSVRASWIWDNIVADNGLTIVKPSDFTTILRRLALPFTTHQTSGGRSVAYVAQKYSYSTRGVEAVMMFYGGENAEGADFSVAPIYSTIKLDGRDFSHSTIGLLANLKATATANAVISFDAGKVVDYATLCLAHYSDGGLVREYKTEIKGARRNFSGAVTCDIEMEASDYLIFYVRLYNQTGFDSQNAGNSSVLSFNLTFNVSADGIVDQVMGGMINTRDNLPDISQLDFVKALCAMYGLWASLVDGEVHLVRYADLYAQTPLDWSHKLIGTGDGDAGKTTYTLSDYAQRNILRYKEDDTVKVNASGALVVDNNNLDREKNMLTLPFAASDGNVIPHLKWKDDVTNGEVEEQKVEPRVMMLSERSIATNTYAKLSFDGLKFSQLIPEYYNFWQKIMRNPIVIEEKVQLSEIDIKTLDFRKPIYLQKYGAQFVVDKVQWTEGEPSTVTLVKLPPAKQIGVAQPYTVTTGVTFGSSITGTAVEPTPAWAYLVQGAGEYFAENATLSFDEATANSEHGIAFVAWTTEAGRVLSTDNPFVYDGSNGDMTIYANTADTLS